MTNMPPQIKQAKLEICPHGFRTGGAGASCGCSEGNLYVSLADHKSSLLEQLEAIIKEVEGKKKTNCGCPPFHPNHNGPCDDKDHSELNSALSDLLTKLRAEKELIGNSK